MGRFNHLHPPFNNPKVRQAAMAAFAQEPFLQAQVGIKEFYRSCPSMFTCNTPYGSPKGTDVQSKSNMKKAQELLKASGYDGTAVVLMKPTDRAAIQKLPEVGAQLLRQAGFKVDLQAMDWNTVVSRRAKKDPPAQGGWNMFFTAWVAPDIWNPLTNPAVAALGEKSWFSWPTDEKLENLRDQLPREPGAGPPARRAVRHLARPSPVGRSRPVVLLPHRRRDADRAAPGADLRPRHADGADRNPGLDPARRAGRMAPGRLVRPRADGLLGDGLLGAGIRARLSADLAGIAPARLAAGSGVRAPCRWIFSIYSASDSSGDHAFLHLYRSHRPRHARLGARSARRGLHPHRARQRPAGNPRPGAPCARQRRRADRHCH